MVAHALGLASGSFVPYRIPQEWDTEPRTGCLIF